MNLLIVRSALVSTALCGLLLGGCNAVESVDQPAFTPPPTQTAVLEGKITGLGTRRPLVLSYSAGSADRSFLGILDQSTTAFTFGSLPVGTPYSISVRRQPFGKSYCTVANGAGTISTVPADITVSCVNDATPRFCVGGTITQAVHDTPGAQLILTTEEGTSRVAAATQPVGTPGCWFPNSIFDSQTSVPVFTYSVAASFPDANGTRNNCGVTNPTNPTSGAGSEAGPLSPTGAVTNVQVTTCSFPVNVTVAYNGTPVQALAAPITMELRDPRTGQRVLQKDPVSGNNMQVPALTVSAFGTVTFTGILSNVNAMYDLVITSQPTVGGQQVQTCVVGNTGAAQLTAGSAVLLIDPADPTHGFVPAASTTNPALGISKNVRCRAYPLLARQLRGTYQQTSIETTTTGTPAVSITTTTTNRNFITFFEDGTFLYDVHALGNQAITTVGTVPAAVPNSGVEHGFYDYNNIAATIAFTPLTDSITGTNTSRISTAGAAATLTNLVKIQGPLSRLTGTFGAAMKWRLDEPVSIDSQMTGAWASADHRQVWVYEANNYRGLYVGVNGLPTAADSCWPIDPTTALSGYFSRRGNATTCELGEGPPGVSNIYTMTIPNAASVPRLPEGYVGRWPQSQTNVDGRPSSPASFLITPGIPDKLTVQDTLNGVPVYPPFVFFRIRPN